MTPPLAWFGPDRRDALLDFWKIYDDGWEAFTEATVVLAADHPEFGPIVKMMPKEMMDAENRASRERMRRAIDGDWQEYETVLRQQGVAYAAMGVSFRGWYDIVRAFQTLIVPRLVTAFAGEPARLGAALLVQQELLDRAMVIICESYFAAKEAALVAVKLEQAAERERAAVLEGQNQRIQEANRLKSEFLTNMSHELRTPLNSIIGFAQLLHQGEVEPGSPEHQEFLGDIFKSGRHLLQLINDVLDLAKVEAGKLEFHPEPFVLEKVVGEVVSLLRTTAAAKLIALKTSIDPAIGTVVADPGRLKQILYNYLSNALKFTNEGGTVMVRASMHDGDFFCLEVEDSGIGIAAEDLHKLFIEFQQLDGGLSKKHSGTGLGLALTKRLIEAQGGTLGVRSEVGKGSVFFAILPRQATTGRALPEARALPGTTATALRVLIVEDDERDQSILVRALHGAGFSVETAATGAQALARCRETVFDAITLDILLPDMNGLDLLATIRRDSLSKAAHIVVVSVINEPESIAGFAVDDVLSKPVDEGALVKAIEQRGLRASGLTSILVIDDDETSLRLMNSSLTRLGYRVSCAQDGEEAMALVGQQQPDAVILDLVMPKVDGFEFLARFRSDPQHRSVPVIVWTMKDLSWEERTQLHSSAQRVLQKGASSGRADLLSELRQLLATNARARSDHGG